MHLWGNSFSSGQQAVCQASSSSHIGATGTRAEKIGFDRISPIPTIRESMMSTGYWTDIVNLNYMKAGDGCDNNTSRRKPYKGQPMF